MKQKLTDEQRQEIVDLLGLNVKIGKVFSVKRLAKSVRDRFPTAVTVSDANEPRLIHVTEPDRKSAVPQDPFQCAMAQACKREWKATEAWIGMSRAYVQVGTHLVRYNVPDSVSREQTSFDRHEDFATGTYRLSAVPKSSVSARLGGKKHKAGRTGKGPKKSSPKNKLPMHFTARIRAVEKLKDAKAE